MTEALSVRRLLPCPGCGYDLRGRFLGENCPECGWTIDAPGPRWCTAESLHRLGRMAGLARLSAVLLAVVPFLLLLVAAGLGPSPWWLFGLLGPSLVLHAYAVWRLAIPELGSARIRTLRRAAVVRNGAISAGLLVIVFGTEIESAGPMVARLVYMASYLLLPLAAIGADFLMLRALGSLRSESEAPVTGWHAVMPAFARWALLGAYPLILVPFVGWLFGPVLWAVALSFGFAQVRAVAEACRRQLP